MQTNRRRKKRNIIKELGVESFSQRVKRQIKGKNEGNRAVRSSEEG